MEKEIIKAKIEELLFSLGFNHASVNLAKKTNEGQAAISCYKYDDLYCNITFVRQNDINGEPKDWVLIEYADSLYQAERWMFEDGDMISLDVPIEQIIFELKVELLEAINSRT